MSDIFLVSIIFGSAIFTLILILKNFIRNSPETFDSNTDKMLDEKDDWPSSK